MNKKDFEEVEKAFAERRKAELIKQGKCNHEFVHVSNKGWWGCETVIYCKKCGRVKVE